MSGLASFRTKAKLYTNWDIMGEEPEPYLYDNTDYSDIPMTSDEWWKGVYQDTSDFAKYYNI